MLRYRLLSAAALLALVAGCLWLDWHAIAGLRGGVWLLPLLLFFATGTAWEMANMLAQAQYPIRVPVAVCGATLTAACAAIPMLWELGSEPYPPNCPVGRLGWLVIGAIASVGLAFLAEMIHFQPGKVGCASRIAHGSLVVAYVGLPLAMLVVIRDLGSEPRWGIAALVTLIAVTKSSDAGAYFVGKAVGRHKLIPRLSPGKTWEGGVGGVLTSILVAFVCCQWLIPAVSGSAGQPAPWWGPIVLGASCAISGMFGDLAESLVKRDTGVKDSGRLLPGLGGVWDVTDSLIGASLPGFLCFVAGTTGGIP